MELVQSESITPNHPSIAAGCMERLLLPSWSKLSSAPSFTHRQKAQGCNEPCFRANSLVPDIPACFSYMPPWLMGMGHYTRNKNSLGKFPEHKLRAYPERLPWNPALTHSREKDKRRKSGKGANEGSRERSGKNRCVSSLLPPSATALRSPHRPWTTGKHPQIHSLVATWEM